MATDAHPQDAHHLGGGHDHEHSDGATEHDADQAEPLGPVDRQAWGAAIVGIILALVVAGSLYLSLNA